MPGLERPLEIRKNEKASLYLQEIRDEAHRFAVAYNRLLRKKAIAELWTRGLRSGIETIP